MNNEISPVIEVQNKHVTIRSFTTESVSNELLNQVIEAGRRAPTSSNMQAYSIITIKNHDIKKKLSILAGNQKHVETCPVFLAFCADIHRLKIACSMHDIEMAASLESTFIATIDASLVGMSVQTAIESLGMGGVMIGALRNNLLEVAELLGLPPGVFVVFGMCVGWPEKSAIPKQKPRLPRALVVHEEQYNTSNEQEEIASYDKTLADHYGSQNRNLASAAWSGIIARSLGKRLRPDLGAALAKLGMSTQ